MYKTLSKISVNPVRPTRTEKQVATYLDGIGFDARMEHGDVSEEYLISLYKDVLEQYVDGKVSQEFVAIIGGVLYPIAFDDVDNPSELLLSTACRLDDFQRYKRLGASQIDTILRTALEKLAPPERLS